MVQPTKTSLIKKEILKQLDRGQTDIQKIYAEVCDELGVERAAVRRIKKQLVKELKRKVEVLDSFASRKPVRQPQASNLDKLTELEQRILELLASKKVPIKFQFIYDILNFDTHYPKITKKRLTYYLCKLTVGKLIKRRANCNYIIGETNE